MAKRKGPGQTRERGWRSGVKLSAGFSPRRAMLRDWKIVDVHLMNVIRSEHVGHRVIDRFTLCAVAVSQGPDPKSIFDELIF